MKKKTLIIGGCRGIGKNIFESIKKRGDEVFCVCRSNINKKNFIRADITKKEGLKSIQKFFQKTKINNLIFSQRYRGNSNEEEYEVILKATNNIIKISKFNNSNSSIVIIGSIASTTIVEEQNESYHFMCRC